MEANEHESSRTTVSTVEGTAKRLRWKRTLRAYLRSVVMENLCWGHTGRKEGASYGKNGKGAERVESSRTSLTEDLKLSHLGCLGKLLESNTAA